MAEVIIIRHAESHYNVESERYSKGEIKTMPLLINCDITEKGVEQAKQKGIELTEKLKDYKNDILYIVSPLKRTLNTFYWISRELNKNNIKYESEINHLCRERKSDPSDFLDNEKFERESLDDLHVRINKFKEYLFSVSDKY